MARPETPRNPLTPEQAELVKRGYNLIPYAIKKYGSRFRALDGDEMFSAGQWGLIKAAQGYDPAKAKWSTYALRCIYLTILRDANHRSLVKVPMYLKTRKGKQNRYASFAKVAWCVCGSGGLDDFDVAQDDRGDDIDFDPQELIDALATMPPREQLVIDRCVYQNQTLKVVGESIGVCKERVRQIRDEAIERLRKLVTGERSAKC